MVISLGRGCGTLTYNLPKTYEKLPYKGRCYKRPTLQPWLSILTGDLKPQECYYQGKPNNSYKFSLLSQGSVLNNPYLQLGRSNTRACQALQTWTFINFNVKIFFISSKWISFIITKHQNCRWNINEIIIISGFDFSYRAFVFASRRCGQTCPCWMRDGIVLLMSTRPSMNIFDVSIVLISYVQFRKCKATLKINFKPDDTKIVNFVSANTLYYLILSDFSVLLCFDFMDLSMLILATLPHWLI